MKGRRFHELLQRSWNCRTEPAGAPCLLYASKQCGQGELLAKETILDDSAALPLQDTSVGRKSATRAGRSRSHKRECTLQGAHPSAWQHTKDVVCESSKSYPSVGAVEGDGAEHGGMLFPTVVELPLIALSHGWAVKVMAVLCGFQPVLAVSVHCFGLCRQFRST